ncbi:hypothetical protein [Sulfuriferula sp.]|uniref:hypothetical protein n=1 Tax=Sulfuriferula sp. TaxID=2025307 RepID=UPI00273184A1|nr:hypothetical protein [Sulfuriferula sp.]MDP2024905.1 hypothetical protein [Sulfuriferula sp.]
MTRPLSAFCRADYRALLEDLANRGYRCVDLEGLASGGRVVFCRHDVDLSLNHAAEMAELEHAMGVQATYYVLLSTDMYNLAQVENRNALRRMASLGHTVALHFDATKYAEDRGSLEQAAADECALLETISGSPVTSLSFHRPAAALLGLVGSFAGRAHTYEPRFFSRVAYVSDSNGGWHHGHPLDHVAVRAGEPIQLLTHPIWWMQDEATSAIAAIERFRHNRGEALQRDLARTVKQYGEWLSQIGVD